MTSEGISVVSWGTLFGLVWVMVITFLLWAYASKGEEKPLKKEMIVRYIGTVFLLFILQIAALAITFLPQLSYPLPHVELTQQLPHTVSPSN